VINVMPRVMRSRAECHQRIGADVRFEGFTSASGRRRRTLSGRTPSGPPPSGWTLSRPPPARSAPARSRHGLPREVGRAPERRRRATDPRVGEARSRRHGPVGRSLRRGAGARAAGHLLRAVRERTREADRHRAPVRRDGRPVRGRQACRLDRPRPRSGVRRSPAGRPPRSRDRGPSWGRGARGRPGPGPGPARRADRRCPREQPGRRPAGEAVPAARRAPSTARGTTGSAPVRAGRPGRNGRRGGEPETGHGGCCDAARHDGKRDEADHAGSHAPPSGRERCCPHSQ